MSQKEREISNASNSVNNKTKIKEKSKKMKGEDSNHREVAIHHHEAEVIVNAVEITIIQDIMAPEADFD